MHLRSDRVDSLEVALGCVAAVFGCVGRELRLVLGNDGTRVLLARHLTGLEARLVIHDLLSLLLVGLLDLQLKLLSIVESDKRGREKSMRVELGRREDHLVGRHKQELVLQLLLVSAVRALKSNVDRACHIRRQDVPDDGPWRLCNDRACSVGSHEVEVVETFSNLAQLVLVLFVVQRRSNGLDRLVALSLAVLRHQNDLTLFFVVDVVERLALNHFLLEQEVVICGDWVVHVRLQTELHVVEFDGDVFARLHLSDHVVEDLDLVDADLDAV